MRHRFISGLLILLMMTGNKTFSQEKFITLSGIVTDAEQHLPIPYASIQLKRGSSGTFSNTSGHFILKIPTALLPDTLLVSCIGYKPTLLPIAPHDQLNTVIRLESGAIALKSVTVSARTGLALLKEAIARIPQLYDTTDVRLTAFYREYIRFRKDTLNFNESVLDIYKTYHTDKNRQDQIRILKGRKKTIDIHVDPRFFGWISNITNTAYSSLSEDIQKNIQAEQSFMNEKNFRYYNYDYQETVVDGDRTLLVISISPKKPGRKALITGKLYLDEATLVIAKCDWALTPEGIDYVNRHGKGGVGYTIMSVILKSTIDFTAIKTSISYKYYRGKWYLANVQRHWNADVNSRKRGITDAPWEGDFNLSVTDIHTGNVQRFSDNVSNKVSSVNQLISNNYDTAFWENYNIILPESPDALRKPPPANNNQQLINMPHVSNRQNDFTHADTLRGMLTPFRTCYDVTFYHLDVDVDMNNHFIKGSNSIRFKALQPFSIMQVDLYANMQINSILYKGQPLTYTREYNAVFVRFPETMPAGSTAEIVINYEGSPQVPDTRIPMYGGVLWGKDKTGNPWAQVACQGSGASLWWPNKDHQSDEPDSMRIWVTVANGFTEISNGRLQHTTPVGTDKTRYEWYVSYPINNYNVTFNIGHYAHFSDTYIRHRDTLTLDYYTMPYNQERAKGLYVNVKPMLACLEQHFGAYPFPRDGFTLVESLYPMEHQSGVCIGRILDDTTLTDLPSVIWHESAHEWWGNSLTSKDIADMWIHEAFATYAESLVIECAYGRKAAVDMLNQQREQVRNQEPVTGVYNVNHIFYDIGDMYTKGSLLLHTFRHVLDNDTIWFNLLKDIQHHFRYQTLSAGELISYICERTHHNYSPLFEQYLRYTNIPQLQFSLKQLGRNLELKYRWNANATGFDMPIKVSTSRNHFSFIYPSKEWKTITLKNMNEGDFAVDEDNFYVDVQQR
ncbi:MAG TPA: M1 family aminopeptidase [Chitinophaga sp.]|uniref:M1 family aminopeptidase n=1 Tax=Chitinophaga sp. TaxID=1869181 RepID=UPI002BEBBE59|nr:M1 family aminopeptidase [Chitinophaga sp.]HVI46110.1 M1 family aminopeptidase [Chitinophaga sp.]